MSKNRYGNREEIFVKSFKNYRKQWESTVKLTPSEKINSLFIPSFTLDRLETVVNYFEDLQTKTIERRKYADETEKESIDCWIGMNNTTIDICKILMGLDKARRNVKLSKEKFLKEESFENTKNFYLDLVKEVAYLENLSQRFKEKASFQDKLIFLTKEKYKEKHTNWSDAVLTDILVILLEDGKIPITTLVKIIRKVGISAYNQIKSTSLQSKQLDQKAKRILELNNLLKKDLNNLEDLLPK